MSTFKFKRSKQFVEINYVFYRNMDNWIGRTAHIKLLDCEPFLEMLAIRYKDFFA